MGARWMQMVREGERLRDRRANGLMSEHSGRQPANHAWNPACKTTGARGGGGLLQGGSHGTETVIYPAEESGGSGGFGIGGTQDRAELGLKGDDSAASGPVICSNEICNAGS